MRSPVFCSVAVLLLVAAAYADNEEYKGAQIVEVERSHLGELIAKAEELRILGGNSTIIDLLVPKEKLKSAKRAFENAKLTFRTKVKDLFKAIEESTKSVSARRSDGRMNWDQYQRLSVIHNYIEELARKYSFVSVIDIGKTFEGRSMKLIKISSGKPNAKIMFIDGGIHAREWVSPATVTYAIHELVENRANLPSDIRDLDFYILPVLNPDGYEYTHTNDRMWRKNRQTWPDRSCVGADINRNFDFEFGGKGTSGNSCDETFRGPYAASELETRNMVKFLSSIAKNLKAYVSFHSYGQYILVPYGFDFDMFANDFSDMKAVGESAAAAMRRAGGSHYKVGNTANMLYPAAGGSDDWTKAKLKVRYAYCIELRDDGRYGFLLPAREILRTAKEAFEGIKVIASAAARA